ncbi:hypothetical protein BD779DRAFT_1572256 [Infundibulicybe gibba]|nr:hypothetical protein BD779DRAFT_1572256 [Infundibulicybe gibba]
MAAPSQEFPPWLTNIVTTITDPNGVPLTTSASVMFLPLTYYGPSIPLNSDWTYGGLTSPASSSTLSTTATTSLTTTSATPTSLTITNATPTPTPIPTATVPTSTTTPRPSVSSTASLSSSLTRGQLIGIIIASILGLIFLLVRKRSVARFSDTPIDDDYHVVVRTPGEGSPRHSGEEADPFLQQSAGPSRPRSARVPPPPIHDGSHSSSSKTASTNTSGYGVLLDRPTLRIGPQDAPSIVSEERRGKTLPYDTHDPRARDSAQYSPLMPPPRLVDPASHSPDLDYLPAPTYKPHHDSYVSHRSASPMDLEDAPVLTARRVRVEDLAPRGSKSTTASPVSSSGGWMSGLGLGLGNIKRMSWFTRNSGDKAEDEAESGPLLLNYPGSSSSPPPLPEKSQLRMQSQPQMSQVRLGDSLTSSRGRAGPDSARPLSSVSARSGTSVSGGTIYHDAYSSIPTTPVLAALPRALTPGSPQNRNSWHVGNRSLGELGYVPTAPPPAYEFESSHSATANTFGTGHTNTTNNTTNTNTTDQTNTTTSGPTDTDTTAADPPAFVDILDMPVPRAVGHFASDSLASSTSAGSLKYPPGLVSLAGADLGGDMPAHELGRGNEVRWVGGRPGPGGLGAAAGIAIEVLEEEPPSAAERWRALATSQGSPGDAWAADNGRRTTFGIGMVSCLSRPLILILICFFH